MKVYQIIASVGESNHAYAIMTTIEKAQKFVKKLKTHERYKEKGITDVVIWEWELDNKTGMVTQLKEKKEL